VNLNLDEPIHDPKEFELDQAACDSFPMSQRILESAKAVELSASAFGRLALLNRFPVMVQPDKKKPLEAMDQLPGCILDTGRRGPYDLHGVDVMVVGKKPGLHEMSVGRGYVGPTGKLIRDICAELGIDCSNWYMTNICRYMPTEDGALTSFQLEDGKWFLAQELALIKPRFLLVLGADAVKAVFGKKLTLAAVRSQPHLMRGWQDLGNVTTVSSEMDILERRHGYIQVLATTNPSAVLREAGQRDGLVADFKIFGTMLKGGSGMHTETFNYRQIRTSEETEKLLLELVSKNVTELALDAEWGFTGIAELRRPVLRSIQLCWKAGEVATFIFHDAGGKPAQQGAEMAKIMDCLRTFMLQPDIKLIGHNLRADALLLGEYSLPVMERHHFDTMLVDHLFNENAEHGLEACSVRYTTLGRYDLPLENWLKANEYNKKMKEQHGYLHVPDELLYPYAAKDADATFRIYEVLKAKLETEPTLKQCYYKVVHPACLPIHEIERTGLFADIPRLKNLVELYGKKEEELLQVLRRKLNDKTFNPGSYKQVASLLFGSTAAGGLGLVPVKSTGKPSLMWEDVMLKQDPSRYNPATDQETLEALAGEHPFVSLLRDHRLVNQIHKTFLRDADTQDTLSGEMMFTSGLVGYIDPDGRVRTHLNQMSETGRHKSSRPNCFSADTEVLTEKGWKLFTEIDGLKLAQYDVSDRVVSFALPTGYVEYASREMIHLSTEQQLDMLVTPDHGCLLQQRKTGKFRRIPAVDYPQDYKQYGAGLYVGGPVSMRPSQLVLIAALQADGSITPYGHYDFSFTKQRKIDRLESALKDENIVYRKYESRVNNLYRGRFYVPRDHIPEWWKDKKFFSHWILQLDRDSFFFLAEEIWKWDGCASRRSMYCSKVRSNTDWAQILTVLSGRRGKIREYKRNGQSYWQVDASHRDYSMTTSCKVRKVSYNGPVYCVTMPLGTVVVRRNGKVAVTGQCQNFPKKQDKQLSRVMGDTVETIRSCFTASPGYVLVEADYVSAEVFTLGYLSNCMKLIEDAKGDLHSRGAVTRFGAPKWDGFDAGKPPPELWKEEHKAIRTASKTTVFGIPYGRGSAAIAREIVKSTQGKLLCDTRKAQEYIDGFYAEYPEVRAFIERCKGSVLTPGYLTNPFGRHRRATQTDDLAHIAAQQREFVNFPIQSTVADALNTALVNLYYYRKENPDKARYRILLAIHDAVLLECKPEYLDVMVNDVIPSCMTHNCVIPAWQPGPRWPEETKPFKLETSVEVGVRWQEKPTAEELKERGVPDHWIKKLVK
jgi:uracil-DNA glycosylase family 4